MEHSKRLSQFFFFVFFLLLSVVSSYAQIEAVIEVENDHVCKNSRVEFVNKSTIGENILYQWDFGKGSAFPATTGSATTQVLFYDDTGVYTITLIAFDKNDPLNADTASVDLYVHRYPEADFSWSGTKCAPADYSFTNNSSLGDGEIDKYTWYVNGNAFEGSEVEQRFEYGGDFQVTLFIEDEFGCSDVVDKTVTVLEKPNVDFENNTGAACSPPFDVSFENKTAADYDLSYTWKWNDEKFSSAETPSNKRVTDYNTYNVILIAEGEYGNCINSASKIIEVDDIEATIRVYKNKTATGSLIADGETVPRGIYTIHNGSLSSSEFKWIIDGEEYTDKTLVWSFCEKKEYNLKLVNGIGLACPDTSEFSFSIEPALNDSFVFIDSGGNEVADDGESFESACNRNAELNNIYSASQSVWTVAGNEYKGANPSIYNCKWGETPITLISDYNGKCADTITRSIVLKDCFPRDVSLMQDSVAYSINQTVCADTVTIINNVRNYYAKWEYQGEEINRPDVTIPFCYAGKNYIKLITTFTKDCIDTALVEVKTKKCVENDFSLFVLETNEEVKDQGMICYDNLYAEINNPDQFHEWIVETTTPFWNDTLKEYVDSVEVINFTDPKFRFKSEGGSHIISLVSLLETGCLDTVSKYIYNDPVSAAFAAEVTGQQCPYPIDGYAQALYLGEAEFQWNVQGFGSGTGPDITFSAEGDFFVEHPGYAHQAHAAGVEITLTAISPTGCVMSNTETVGALIPAAKLIADSTTGCRPVTAYFMDDSRVINEESPILEYVWDWGDGTSSVYKSLSPNAEAAVFVNCLRTRADVEEATIKLLDDKVAVVDDSVAVVQCSKYDYMTKINDCECVSDFKTRLYDEYLLTHGYTESFDVCVKKAAEASGKYVNHTYDKPGDYNVTLQVKDETGCPDYAYAEVNVGDSIYVEVDVLTVQDTLLTGDLLEFTFISDDLGLIDEWSFNSNPNNLNIPCEAGNNPEIELTGYEHGQLELDLSVNYNGCKSRVYNYDTLMTEPGLYPIFLVPWYEEVVEDDAEKKGEISYNGNWGTLSPLIEGCETQTVKFDFWPRYDIGRWGLDLGDGTIVEQQRSFEHTYSEPGKYEVKFLPNVTSPDKGQTLTELSITEQIHAEITIAPEDSLVCAFSPVTFSSANSKGYGVDGVEPFLWFVDGVPLERTWLDSVVFNEFDEPKLYTISLRAYNGSYCYDETSIQIRSTKPNAEISFDKDHVCSPLDDLTASIVIDDKSIVDWKWGGDNGKLPAPDELFVTEESKTYEVNGKTLDYTVSLIARDTLGCLDTVKNDISIYDPIAGFTIDDTTVCVGELLNIRDLSYDNDSVVYRFSNGLKLVDEIFMQVSFANSGRYEVVATASQGDCSAEERAVISVQGVDARFSASDDFICRNDQITFKQLSMPNPVTSTWTFTPDDVEKWNGSSPEDITHTFDKGGEFTVVLEAETSYGCYDRYDTVVKVLSAKPYIVDPTICKGESAKFNNPDGFASQYDYDFGNGEIVTVYNNDFVSATYNERGTYSITVTAHSDECSDTYTDELIFVEEVDARFEMSDSIICNFYPGNNGKNFVKFLHTSSPDPIVSGNWVFYDDAGKSLYQGPNAVHHYQKPGVFTTSLEVTTAYGCTDKAEKTIYVNGTLGDFKMDREEICIHDEVKFIPVDLTNVDSLAWYFDDGISSLDMSPSHTYTADGMFKPILELYDTTGCINIIGDKSLQVYEVIAGFDVSNPLICQYDTLQIDEFSSSASQWDWEFGNGDTRDVRDPDDYAYKKAGKYTVTLVASNHINCSDEATVDIEVFPVPHPEFMVDKPFMCAPMDSLELTYIPSDESIAEFIWSFGTDNSLYTDGEINHYFVPESLNDTVVKHEYTSTIDESYTILVAATDTIGCKNRDTIVVDLHAPTAEFDIEDPLGCKGEEMLITNTSFSVDSVVWDYGNGTTESSLVDVAPVFDVRGDYEITAIGFRMGECKDTLTQVINVEEVYAQFDFTSDYVCDEDTIYYKHISIPDPVTGTWYFTESDSIEYKVKEDSAQFFYYAKGGEYSTKLVVETENGCIDSAKLAVKVNEAMPITTDTAICAGSSIEVSNVVGLAQEYIWDFGNGVLDTTTTNDPIMVVYPERGDYSISLIAYHPQCSDTVVTVDAINVQEIDASFSMSDSVVCGIDTIRFTHIDIPDEVTGVWTFEKNQSQQYAVAADSSVVYEYTKPGYHTVSLEIETSNGCTDIVDTLIRVVQAIPLISDETICIGDSVEFVNNGDWADGYEWEFGNGEDSIITENIPVKTGYPLRGDYTIELIAKHADCADTVEVVDAINVQEINADFKIDTYFTCDEKDITLTHKYIPDSVFGTWDFGDGNKHEYLTLNDSVINYAYNDGGKFTVELTVETTNGCKDTATQVMSVNKAEYVISDAMLCEEDIVTVHNSNSEAERYEWYVAGLDTVINTNNDIFELQFNKRGVYPLTLVAFNQHCSDTIEEPLFVKVEAVDAQFTLSDTVICNAYPSSEEQKNLVEMIHTYYPDSIIRGEWALNGFAIKTYPSDPLSNHTISHLITQLGDNYVTLSVETKHGCKDEFEQKIEVNGSEGEFSIDTADVCKGDAITFTPANLVQVERMEWVYGDNKTSNKEEHVYRYDTVGEFKPYVILYDATGCVNSLPAVDLHIYEVVADFAVADTDLCIGEVVQIADASGETTQWQWEFGDGSLGSVPNPERKSYKKEGDYTITLKTFNDLGCSDTLSKSVKVYPHPPITITGDDIVCLDSIAYLSAEYDQKIAIEWFKDGASYQKGGAELSDPELYENAVYSTVVTDSLGCVNTDEYSVAIRPYPIWKQNLEDTTVLIGEKVTLTASSNYPSEYVWSPELNVLKGHKNVLMVRALEDQTYSVVVSDVCHTEELFYEVNVEEKTPCKAMLPTAFSPNGDGENDIAKIRGWGLKSCKFFQIFNRYGQLVFETDDLNKGWDGTKGGKAQGLDTYTFQFLVETYCGEDIRVSGYITLLR